MTDILIRGMEMPTDSPVYLTVCPSGGVYVHAYERGYGALVKSQYRVVELPEHGDLISKDDAMNAILGEPPEARYPSWYASIVNEIPAIVPSNKEETE